MEERDRWQSGIGVLLSVSLVLFLLVIVLNAGTVFVGTVLLVFQVLILLAVAVLLVGLAWWIGTTILDAVTKAEGRIREELESLRRTLLRTTNKLGADILSFVTGGLALVIQETLTDYPQLYRFAVSLLFTIVFFLAAQLIGSDRKRDRILGTFFFMAPVVTFFTALLMVATPQTVSVWIAERTAPDLFLIGALILSVLLTFAFAFLKSRDVTSDKPA